MAYDNPTSNSGMGQGGDPGGSMDHMDHEDMGVLHISPDMLPHGMELNEGDIVEFKVIGPKDKDGDWPVEYNMDDYGKDGEGKEEESSWEDDFRKAMSPRSEESEAM